MKIKSDQQWRAEADADVMATYQEIMGDKPRMMKAIKVARERAKDLTKRAAAMQAVTKATGKKK